MVRGKRGSGGIYAAPYDDRTESPETVPSRSAMTGGSATSTDDPAVSGSASFLNCPRCGLSLRPRASWLTIEHCPRCIARDRTAVKLFSYPLPAIEHYGQGFAPNARDTTTDQAPSPGDMEAAS